MKGSAAGLGLLFALGLPFAFGSLGAEPRLILSEGSLRPWRLVEARVEAERSILDELRVVGQTWEGETRLLFRSEGGPGLPSLALAFYLDDQIKSLHLEWGESEARVSGPELAVARSPEAPPPAPPFHPAGLGLPPSRFQPQAADLEGAGREAAAALFLARPPLLSTVILLLFGLGSLILARAGFLREVRRRRAIGFAAALLLALLGGGGALLALPSAREFFVAAFPAAAAPSGSPWPGLAYRGEEEREGWRLRSWGEGEERVFGARLGPGRLLPLDPSRGGGKAPPLLPRPRHPKGRRPLFRRPLIPHRVVPP